MPTELPPPVALSLMVCDSGTYDNITGKYSLQGTLSGLTSTGFPCALATFCVYAALTNGRSTLSVRIRLVDANERGNALFEVQMPANFPDPTHVVEMMFLLPGLRFPEPGDYRTQLHAGGQLLAERRLLVEQVPPSDVSIAEA